MAATPSSSHFPCPTFSSNPTFHYRKQQLLVSPFSAAPPKSNRSTSPAVSSRQNICMPTTLRAFRSSSSPALVAKASLDREPMVPPYNVLITGSTKGIGYALAKEFLKAGDNVIISSRSYERVETVVQSLRAEFGEQHVELNVM